MKIKCICGNMVVEGEINESAKGRKRLQLFENPKGTIEKNKSKNPKDWTGVCSKCQMAKSKKLKTKNK